MELLLHLVFINWNCFKNNRPIGAGIMLPLVSPVNIQEEQQNWQGNHLYTKLCHLKCSMIGKLSIIKIEMHGDLCDLVFTKSLREYDPLKWLYTESLYIVASKHPISGFTLKFPCILAFSVSQVWYPLNLRSFVAVSLLMSLCTPKSIISGLNLYKGLCWILSKITKAICRCHEHHFYVVLVKSLLIM